MSKIHICLPYEDELLYSVLARTRVKNGYIAYTYAAEDFFLSPKTRPDIEFVNAYSDGLLEELEKIKTFSEWIQENTMFYYYSHFIPEDRKTGAFESLMQRNGEHGKNMCMPAKGNRRFLRICPICYRNEIQTYGEAYWHRSHQMMEMDVCTIHNCRLMESTVKISGTASPSLITASEEFGGEIRQEVQYVSGMELALAKYVTDTFKEVSVIGEYMTGRFTSKFLYDNLEGTKYVSARGEQRHMSLLQSNFNDYYSELRGNSFLLKDYEQLQKIFTGYRFNFYEICQVGMFLEIPPKELAALKNDKSIERQIKAYDNRIIEMSVEGISGNEIARRIGASSRTVRIILDKQQKNESDNKNKTDTSDAKKKCGPKPKDWKKQDNEYLPKVDDAINLIYGAGDARPHKVTVFAVSKILGLPDKALYRMPKCLAKIKSYEESQEDYWRREVLWAIRTTKAAKREVNWRRIRELTNLRRSQFEALNISIDSL